MTTKKAVPKGQGKPGRPRKVPLETRQELPLTDDKNNSEVIELREDERVAEETQELLFDAKKIPGSEPVVRINRREDYTQRWLLHGYLAVEEATERRVMELWGGGNYEAMVISADESGKRIYRMGKRFRLLGLYKVPTEIYGIPKTAQESLRPQPQAEVHTGTPPGQGQQLNRNDLLSDILLNQVLDVVKASKQPAPGTSMLTELIPLGIELVRMFSEKRNDRDPILEELRELRRAMGERVSVPVNAGPATNTIADIVAAMKLLRGASDNPAEKAADPDAALLSLGERVLEIMAHRSGQTPPVPQLPATGPDPRPIPIWAQLLRRHGNLILGAARRGVDPTFAAEMLARFLPSEQEGVLIEFVNREDAPVALLQAIPELADFRSWSENVITSLKAMYAEEEEGEHEGEEDLTGR